MSVTDPRMMLLLGLHMHRMESTRPSFCLARYLSTSFSIPSNVSELYSSMVHTEKKVHMCLLVSGWVQITLMAQLGLRIGTLVKAFAGRHEAEVLGSACMVRVCHRVSCLIQTHAMPWDLLACEYHVSLGYYVFTVEHAVFNLSAS